MSADGVTGDWLPLGTLVRLPGFKELRCPRTVAKPCTLTGSNLFLATSLAASPDFNNAVDVPPDFTGTQLSVPHPTNGNLYLRLRDDPATVQTLTLPVTPIGQPVQQTPAAATQPTAAPAQPNTAPAQPAAAPAQPTAAPPAQPENTQQPSKPTPEAPNG
jgi:pyruvate/2-oxoglutarate dehydrogenase complex dihydrolipoamide acyltransferase (E2) component